MIINNKYDYKPLSRVDHPSGRRYIVGEGRALPSVTTILSKTKDMTHILEWRESVGEAEAARITAEASGLGNNMHNLLEKYILGQEMKGQIMAMSLAKLIIKKGLCNVNEVWGTEVGLYSKELYAGTTDLVGLHNGIPSIMDFKNSRQEKKKEWIEDYFLQCCAYSLCHNEMYGTDIKRGVIMMATREGKYLEFIIEGNEFDYYTNRWLNKLEEYYKISDIDK